MDADEAAGQPAAPDMSGGEIVAMDAARAAGEHEVQARQLLERSRRSLDRMHAEDREEAIELHDRIEAAIAAANTTALREASRALEELLFFIEGQQP